MDHSRPLADVRPSDRRQFELPDQQRFAALTGDHNPMHMDPVAARRLITGRPVVHGIHTLLVALEWAHGNLGPLRGQRLDCEFVNPVCVGDVLQLALDADAPGRPQLCAAVAGLTCTRLSLRPLAEAPLPEPGAPPDATEWLADLEAPLRRAPAEWVGRQQQLPLPEARFDGDFPRTCAHWGERTVAAIGLLSTYVGMVCPGLHSVFAAATLTEGMPGEALRFEVQKYDPRFRLLIVAFDGPIRGQLRAFVRPEPQTQPDAASLAPLLDSRLFAGRQALVIGGSRGLGELSAKLLAVGGADVTLTYAAGADDAARVVADLQACGRGTARARRLDVMRDDWTAWLGQGPLPDAVFYFASPRIFRKKTGVVDAGLLQEFLDCYVHRFAALCLALAQQAEQQGREQPLQVFVPSTVFIDERPKGMTEYAMAKAATELMVADLGRALPRIRFQVARLPKMATDQTASVVASRSAPGTEVLLPLVQAMMRA